MHPNTLAKISSFLQSTIILLNILTHFKKSGIIMLNLERTIKDLLRRAGKTQKEMCAAIGFSYGALRNSYERNSMEVSVLEKIAAYLGVPMGRLLGESVGDNSLNTNSLNTNSLNTINDGEAINRLVGIIEEKDRQISRLLDLLDGGNSPAVTTR